MPETNFLKQKLDGGALTVGTWCAIPSPTVTNVLGRAGFDYVIIDREHGPNEFETIESMVRAAELCGCSPLVRVSTLDEAEILRALDVGAHGVIVPQIESVEQARAAVAAAKYAPVGTRGFSPYTRSGGYHHTQTNADKQAAANRDTLLVLLVEGPKGLAALGDILDATAESVGSIYIGPYDLANAIGLPGQVDHPDVVQRVSDSFKTIRGHGVAPSTLARSQAEVEHYASLGARMLAYQADVGVLFEAVTGIVDGVRRVPVA